MQVLHSPGSDRNRPIPTKRRSSIASRTPFSPMSTIVASPVMSPVNSSSLSNPSLMPGQLGLGSVPLREAITQAEPITEPGLPTPSIASRDTLSIVVLAPPDVPIWRAVPPTPPAAKVLLRSTSCRSTFVSPSASFPTNLLPKHVSLKARHVPRRRASLPVMPSSKPLPLPPTPDSPPSPTRKSSTTCTGPLRAIGNTLLNRSREPASPIRPKTLFHLASDNTSDNDDDDDQDLAASEDSPEESQRDSATQEGTSQSDHLSDEKWAQSKQKDETRRYHALMELLSSELLYLENLRALVTVYLRQLATLTSRSSAPSSHFGSSSSIGVPTFSRSPSAAVMPSAYNSRLNTTGSTSEAGQPIPAPSKVKNAPRYLFSDLDIEVVTRNAEEILQLHEHFVEVLRAALAPLHIDLNVEDGGAMEEVKPSHVDAAIEVVMTKFTTQASQFNAYESFCSGHTQAIDLVRKISVSHAAEWDAFERRCSAIIAEMGDEILEAQPTLSADASAPPTSFSHATTNVSRRHSLSSLEIPDRSLRGQPPNSDAGHSVTKATRGLRLAFMDYAILPVQRVSRYPLLLEQLKTGKTFRRSYSGLVPGRILHIGTDVNVVVESATQAMRHVARAVDEARRKQDVSTQSSLIVTRIGLASSAGLSSSSTAPKPAFYSVTPSFLTSLGACLLAGSLDILHYAPYSSNHSAVKAKYLASFLYFGYLILAKVNKGKVYEPRHWFPLVGCEIVDVDEKDALLPCSIRLIVNGHHFELAASCQREKEAWLHSLRESLKVTPVWTREPTSSLSVDGKGEVVPSPLDDTPYESIVALPTIQSIPRLESNAEVDSSLAFATKSSKPRGGSLPPTSRRSSTVSVKAMFTASEATIRRSSTAARAVIDRGLLDVISEPCLSARSHATLRDGELFQPSKVLRAPRPSSSGLTMSGTKRNKRESLLVTKRKSFVGKPDSVVEEPEVLPVGSRKLTGLRTKSASKKPAHIPLPLPPPPVPGLFTEALTDSPMSHSPEIFLDSPCDVQSPLASPHIVPIIAPDDIAEIVVIPRQRLLSVEPDYRPKRTRSMVDNVRGFFSTSHAATTTPIRRAFSPEPSCAARQPTAPSPSSKWWKADSLRRRVRSAPDTPAGEETLTVGVNEGPPILPLLNIDGSLTSPVSITNPAVDALAPIVRHQLRDDVPSSIHRRRSVFIPSSFRRPVSESDTTPRKVHRNFSLMNRLSPISNATQT